jgi:hypothetical protein
MPNVIQIQRFENRVSQVHEISSDIVDWKGEKNSVAAENACTIISGDWRLSMLWIPKSDSREFLCLWIFPILLPPENI